MGDLVKNFYFFQKITILLSIFTYSETLIQIERPNVFAPRIKQAIEGRNKSGSIRTTDGEY